MAHQKPDGRYGAPELGDGDSQVRSCLSLREGEFPRPHHLRLDFVRTESKVKRDQDDRIRGASLLARCKGARPVRGHIFVSNEVMTASETIDQVSNADVSALDPSDVYVALGSSPSGLSDAEASRRLREWGPNVTTSAVPSRRIRRFLSNFTHLMAILLWVGGGVAFVAGLAELGVAIWVVNVVNGLFSFWQEHKAEKATEALLRLIPVKARVMRGGVTSELDASRLVPGDVMLVEEGDRISADGRLVEHVSMRVDQSALTGESRLVRKSSDAIDPAGTTALEMPNLVHAGTIVASGREKSWSPRPDREPSSVPSPTSP